MSNLIDLDEEGEAIEDEGLEYVEDHQALEQADTLDRVLALLGADSGVDLILKVYKLDDDTNKQLFCFDITPENLPVEPRLIKQYGGGDFVVKVYAPTPTGSKSIKKTVQISIAKPLENTMDNTSFNPLDNMDMITKIMENNQNAMKEMFTMMALQQENLMLKIADKLGSNKSDSPSVIEMLTLFKELRPEQTANPLNDIKDLLSVTNEIKDFTNPAPQSGFEALTHGVDSLVELVKESKQHPQPPTNTPKNVEPANVPSSTQGDLMNPIVKQQIRKQLAFLCQQAANDNDPVLYADFALDQIPSNYYPQLMDLINPDNEQAFIKLVAIHADVANYRRWFDKFCDAIREAFPDLESDDSLTNDAAESIKEETASTTILDNANKESEADPGNT